MKLLYILIILTISFVYISHAATTKPATKCLSLGTSVSFSSAFIDYCPYTDLLNSQCTDGKSCCSKKCLRYGFIRGQKKCIA